MELALVSYKDLVSMIKADEKLIVMLSLLIPLNLTQISKKSTSQKTQAFYKLTK